MKIRNMAFGLMACVCALGGGGCTAQSSPQMAACTGDHGCRGMGNVCVRGTCQQCRMDHDCGSGMTCNGNRCESMPTAQTTPQQQGDTVAAANAP